MTQSYNVWTTYRSVFEFVVEQSWAGRSESADTEDICFSGNRNTFIDIQSLDGHVIYTCRCGTLVSLSLQNMLDGFTTLECSGCSLKLDFSSSYNEIVKLHMI